MPERTPGPGTPTPPIALAGGSAAAVAQAGAATVDVPDAVLDRLRTVCGTVDTDPATLGEVSRDWWPLAMVWALEGRLPGRAAALVRPSTPEEVAAVLRVCNEARVPVTAAGGRSGVCGASVPAFGGVVLDTCALSGIVAVDRTSLILDVLPGTFGTALEDELRASHNVTLGHWPQSIDLSTVGGWLACRSAGQLSTRYGKIEDMVVGLDVALADGRLITTGGNPRSAVGPDLNHVFVGSEGTLGIITGARLRLHPAPAHERRAAFGFATFADGLEACRAVLQRGGRPAVLRLYDATEADRNYQTGELHVLLVLDEGEPTLVDCTMDLVAKTCEVDGDALPLDSDLVRRWLAHRNDVSALEALITKGFVVDTMEIAAPWAALPGIYERAVAAIKAVPGTLAASAHQSHAYTDGACLYFTFAGRVDADERDTYYTDVWDAGTNAVLDAGGALSHHHGVGMNRSRFVQAALGPAFDVLVALKDALDPNGILNPGKLGLPSPFGEAVWPPRA
jgi:alkyldihydroxyacetonephosphate synthase